MTVPVAIPKLVELARDPALADVERLPARVGLIVPSINSCAEPELQGLAPAGITFHATRLALPTGSPEELLAMAGAAGQAAHLLAHLSPDLVLFHCTAASTALSSEQTAGIVRGIEREVDCPVLTTGSVVLDALRFLSAHSVALVTPYTAEVTAAEAGFLQHHGVAVSNWAALALSPREFPLVSPQAWREIVRRVDTSNADAVFLSCTNTRTLEAISAIEADLGGRAVLTSNQAALWRVMQELGADGQLPGPGRLLATGPPP